MNLSPIKIEDVIIEISASYGEVVEEKQWVESKVSGYGGGSDAQGNINPVRISTNNFTWQEIYVRSPDNNEFSFRLLNTNAQLRKGHFVTEIAGSRKDQNRGFAVAVYNHDLNQIFISEGAIAELIPIKTFPKIFSSVTGAIIGFLITILTCGIGAFVVLIYFFQKTKAIKKDKAEKIAKVQSHLEGLIPVINKK